MKRIVLAFIISVVAAATYAAENAYDFTITRKAGEILGSGKIRLPFKLGTDGNGIAEWQFTPTEAGSTNYYWMGVKARLAAGTGKAIAGCKASCFTLEFNPGWADNNATMSWPLDKAEAGTVSFSTFSGDHPCALFRIARPAQTKRSTEWRPLGRIHQFGSFSSAPPSVSYSLGEII